MPGFVSVINSSIQVAQSKEKECLIETKSSNRYYIERRAIKKFENDKFLLENDEYIFLLDGVILNNHQLMQKYSIDDWKECVVYMHSKNPLTFYNEFRGAFMGLVYSKKDEDWLFYTDHIGDKQIFYCHLPDGGWLVGSEMDYMVQTLRNNHIKLSPNRDAAYMDISMGFVIENNTLVNEIHKLVAGHYLTINNHNIKEIQYHRFSNAPIERTKEEIIVEIDKLFRDAVKLQFEKDKEYGYKHVTCLSGGLDSRMTVWVAHELGYIKQLNATFCQSDYIDFHVAQQIATDLRHDFIFKALDGGNCIYDIDYVTKLSYGLACFFGLAHGASMFRIFDFEEYGIMHTGMLGDVILGTYLSSPQYNIPAKISDGAYSEEVISKLKDYKFRYDYPDSEIYMMYNRGFGFCGQGVSIGSMYMRTENLSPFCNVDFMEYCFSIPLEWRYDHKIYHEWILTKYPAAAGYIWERVRMKIDEYRRLEQNKSIERHYMKIMGMNIPAPNDPYFKEYLKGFILRRLGLKKKSGKRPKQEEENHTFMLPTKDHMNPVDYWYYGNPELKEFMDNYWAENKNLVSDDALLKDMSHLYEECEATFDKLQPLTILAAYKLIFSGK